MTESPLGRRDCFLVLEFGTHDGTTLEKMHVTFSTPAATSAQKLSTTTLLMGRAGPVSVRKRKMREQKEQELFPSRTRELTMLCSGLGRRCSSKRAIVATTTHKTSLFASVSVFARVVDAW